MMKDIEKLGDFQKSWNELVEDPTPEPSRLTPSPTFFVLYYANFLRERTAPLSLFITSQ